MGCSGLREPEMRYTSHPTYVQAIIECLLDCGAKVMFGDDVSRAAKHVHRLWASTGMVDVASRTGAQLVDFVSAGGREVRGLLSYPRTHFITNLVYEADVIVNAASCRSLADVVLSGAIKNMFGTVLGRRKRQLHALFPDIRDFSRALVDIFRLVQPRVSFLDMTTVIEGQGVAPEIQKVGLVLASTDAVALDTVAANAIGYDDLQVWTSIYGQRAGLGCNNINQIAIEGIDWETFNKKRLRHPAPPRMGRGSAYDRLTRFMNNTVLRPRPSIVREKCTGCGDCLTRCPASAITRSGDVMSIAHNKCADCGCCIKLCEVEAVTAQFVGLGKIVRTLERAMRGGSGLIASEIRNLRQGED
jgi:uncharacterized protein (DUF362 family)/ferredoxin